MVYMPHWPISPMRSNIKYDLDRIVHILNKLGNPHKKLPPVIHIAGTNGKGSTLAFLQAIFAAAGYKVHKYTSPHFLNFNERIVLNGSMIEDGYLYSLLEKVRYISDQESIAPSFFEATTAAGFLAFSETAGDVLLLETGLGGRLDATNVIDNPILTIISSISYDHIEYLGPTLKLIAGEKAGIIKNEVPCVISAQTEEVFNVLFDACEKLNSRSCAFGYDFTIEKTQSGFNYTELDCNIDLPTPSLQGDHQLLNAASAIAAVLRLGSKYKVTTEHMIKGLTSTKWPGRLEKLSYGNLYKNFQNLEIWIDGAHNEGGARVVAEWLKSNHTDRDIYMIIGLTKGRNIKDFISQFKGIAKSIYGVVVKSEPSSYTLEALSNQASGVDGINFQTSGSIEEACSQISNESNNQPLVIITGSLFLLSDVHKI